MDSSWRIKSTMDILGGKVIEIKKRQEQDLYIPEDTPQPSREDLEILIKSDGC